MRTFLTTTLAAMITSKRSQVLIVLILITMLNGIGCIQVQFPSRKRTQDSHALTNVRLLVALEKGYHERDGQFAMTVAELATSSEMRLQFNGREGCSKGYCYMLEITKLGFELTAWPDQWNQSGYRSFYADQTGVIRYTLNSRRANANDRPVE